MNTALAPGDLLTVAEAAAILKRTPEALRKQRRQGRGPPFIRTSGRGAGCIRYLRTDLEAWLLARRVDTTPKPHKEP